jgi:F-type H+-transporting ATPase subunit epsilon
MADYNLQIISPDRVEYEGDVESLIAPGEEGYFGVLANHAPMLSALGEGALVVRPTGAAEDRYQISGGFLEVHENQVVVLVQDMEKPATV